MSVVELGEPQSVASGSMCEARRWRIGGRVQGVGFRPFVFRLAQRFELTGWVRNNGGEVEIHGQGIRSKLQAFGAAVLTQTPPAAKARLIDMGPAMLETQDQFRILSSTTEGSLHVHVPLDLFTCNDCLAELQDPQGRRHRYPFINCTQCGPRYTLIRALPYDRANTALDRFTLCADCSCEYADPLDRRFHAEPLACSACGPSLSWQSKERTVSGNAACLEIALTSLRNGAIIAVRGVGGYQLLCDARNEDAVVRLRERKGRPTKPLAIMVPCMGLDGLGYARNLVNLSPLEALLLSDSARPIVIVARRAETGLAKAVAPDLSELGLMLPYSPLHHLLLNDFGAALVATSGNLSGEPVLTDPAEIVARLGHVADGFLHHDRPITRPADDPVIRIVANRARPIRLGRGTAPLETRLPIFLPAPVLAVGAYLKTTIALGWGDRAVVSPHIGDLTSPRGQEVFAQVIDDLQQLYGVRAQSIVHDAHPGFPSTRWARDSGLPTRPVWHHFAHASAVAGEYPSSSELLCFTWDGVGLGPDSTLWGGEALLGRAGAWRRIASFRPFRLPGGERAAREPWRTALALSWECRQPWIRGECLSDPLLRAAWQSGLNAPVTTSVGRLFDAAAAILQLCLRSSYEGEAAMRLEGICMEQAAPVAMPLERDSSGIWRSDWAPLLAALLDSTRPQAERAATFHASLAKALCEQAQAVRQVSGVQRIGLCGGVFQNRLLTEQVQVLLATAGFEVLIPQLLPVNDAAISFGQLVEAAALNLEHA